MVGYENGQCVFRFRCDDATGLFLAGDFKDWSITATPMSWVDAARKNTTSQPGKTWETKLKLPVGEHHFRYVTAEGQWHTDFSAPNVVANPYGGWDSVVIINARPIKNDLIEVKIDKSRRDPPLHLHTRWQRKARAAVLPPLTLLRT